MARATRRGTKVQNSKNETEKLAEETKSTSGVTGARAKRAASANNKSWQELIPKSRKSGEKSGAKSVNSGEKEVSVVEIKENGGNEEEDLADRVKKSRRSVTIDNSKDDNKKVDPVIKVKSKKAAKKPAMKKVSKPDLPEVDTATKPPLKKASKKSFEAAIDEIVDGSKKGRKRKSSEMVEDQNDNIEGETKKTKIRQTRSANNSNVVEGKQAIPELSIDKDEVISSSRSSVEKRRLSRNDKINSEENEAIFTKVLTKKTVGKHSNRVSIKPPPKAYRAKSNKPIAKAPPKKSLASNAILNLLSDDEDVDDDKEEDEDEEVEYLSDALKDKTNTISARTKNLTQSSIQEAFNKTPQVTHRKSVSPQKSQNKFFKSRSPQNSLNSSQSFAVKKVPVWKKKVVNDSTLVSKPDKPAEDVFNMDCYGEEEFGPEDAKAKKKKRAPRKKGTKGILVFGGNTKKQVKQICNLKTPGDLNKRKKRIVNIPDEIPQVQNNSNNKAASDQPPKSPSRLEVPKSIFGRTSNAESSFIPPQCSMNDQTPHGLPQPRRIDMESHMSTDFSTGAQAYFDSHAGDDHDDNGDDYYEGPPANDPEQPMSNRSGLFGQSVGEPPKSYKTPAIPRHMTKLQTENASTPRMEERVQPKEPATVKEQIKNAFGFDDSTDDEEMDGGESFAISPVRKVTDPVLALLNSPSNSICGASSRLSTLPNSRLSTFSTSSRLSIVPKGGFLTSSINAGRKVEEKKDGPFRFTMAPSTNALLAARLVAEAKKMPPKFSKPLPKQSSSLKHPVKSSQNNPSSNMKQTKIPDSISHQLLKVPSVSYGNKHKEQNIIEEVSEAPDNTSDKTGKQKAKKMVKKASKNKHPEADQSSIFEENKPARSKPQRNAAKAATERLEEINKSPEKQKCPNKENSPVKGNKPVAKTYAKRNVSKTSVSFAKTSVSFDVSVPHSPPKKVKVQEKKLNQWAALQTSHFSEVDDFDLSFS